MKKKYLRFVASDGETWDLPKEIPAKNRAEYYAEKDKDTTFDEEFKFAMEDNDEAWDWLRNNMNHEEYSAYLVFVRPPNEIPFMEKWESDDNAEWIEVTR